MNILVCGVGGQGVLLFSDILSHIALMAKLDVKKSEVHGMAQRGGSVTSHIRWSGKVYSPLIEEGTADIIIAFEKLEALRYIHFLSPSGSLIYDPLRIEPLPVLIGTVEKMPDSLLDERINIRAPKNYPVPAFEVACKLGNPRLQNTVMLGAVSRFFEFPSNLYRQVISTLVKPQLVELNLKAFAAGLELIPPLNDRLQ
ncbi:indolepyruvate oxidoreductase subunit beta [candidate division WOR-3 bacterium]|nr:indolepyruvate oxidoreductase subunit beta [candidate division WOR-3 bacterium]